MTGPTLTAPFKNTQEKQKAGRSFTYIPASEVIDRLNAVWGIGGWSFECEFIYQDAKNVVVKGSLTNPWGATAEQFGGQEIPGANADLGDMFKGAASDAMKKCATHFGVGLYIPLKRTPLGQTERRAGDESLLDAVAIGVAGDAAGEPSSTATGRGQAGLQAAPPVGDPATPDNFDAELERTRLLAECRQVPDAVRVLLVKLIEERDLPSLKAVSTVVTPEVVEAWEDAIAEAHKRAKVAVVTS